MVQVSERLSERMEQTLVLIKPDGVARGLVGEILSRFERSGLKIVALKLVKPSAATVKKFYPSTREWFAAVGEKTLGFYKQQGLDVKRDLGTSDAVEIGKIVKGWLEKWISGHPVVACVLEGNHAVDNARRLVGATLPNLAAPGTIRGDYAVDSAWLANTRKRPVKNLVHASGTVEEARHEITTLFKREEIFEYERCDEKTVFQ